MSAHVGKIYRKQFKHGLALQMTISDVGICCEWSPDVPPPRVLRKLLPRYRAFRDAAMADYARSQGLRPEQVLTVELWD